MKFNKKTKQGITLIEMIVAIFIATIIMAGVGSFFKQILTTSKQKTQFLDDTDRSRYLVTRFASEIRSASFGADGSYPLNQAGDSQIIFFSLLGQSTATVKRIRYYFSGNTLYKGVIIPTGNPPVYNPNSEVVLPMETNLVSTTTNKFIYYDGNYDGSTSTLPFSQPVNVNLVKFVLMNLVVNKQNNKATTTFSISGGGAIRNLKSNLGN